MHWVILGGLNLPRVQAQGLLPDESAQAVSGEGWRGFMNYAFLGHAVLVLTLAAVLGAVIAYHPRSRKRIDSVEEVEAPKIYITYAVVGAVIGLMVVEYGLVVGFVVFGIGGLFRFRTRLPSVANTGRLILVTLIGLSCGLDLPHLGVLATTFGFVLIFIIDRTITCQVEVKELDARTLARASEMYRALIEEHGGDVIREKKSFSKSHVLFIFRAPYRFDLEDLEQAFVQQIPADLRGSADWTVD